MLKCDLSSKACTGGCGAFLGLSKAYERPISVSASVVVVGADGLEMRGRRGFVRLYCGCEYEEEDVYEDVQEEEEVEEEVEVEEME